MEISIYNNNQPWFYTVMPQDEKLSFEDFAKKFNVSFDEFLAMNPETKIEKGNVFVVPSSSKCFHIVQPLETLEKISKMYNCTIDHLKKTNKIENVFVGQKIYL